MIDTISCVDRTLDGLAQQQTALMCVTRLGHCVARASWGSCAAQLVLNRCALLLQVSNMENSNPRSELEKIKNKVLEYLSQLPPVPSVPLTVMPATTKVREHINGSRQSFLASGASHEGHWQAVGSAALRSICTHCAMFTSLPTCWAQRVHAGAA
jgi:hypothetical protein